MVGISIHLFTHAVAYSFCNKLLLLSSYFFKLKKLANNNEMYDIIKYASLSL